MVQTILQISETNIFPNIVDHAGLTQQLLLFQIESKSQEMPHGQISTSHHKSWFPAKWKTKDVTEVNL